MLKFFKIILKSVRTRGFGGFWGFFCFCNSSVLFDLKFRNSCTDHSFRCSAALACFGSTYPPGVGRAKVNGINNLRGAGGGGVDPGGNRAGSPAVGGRRYAGRRPCAQGSHAPLSRRSTWGPTARGPGHRRASKTMTRATCKNYTVKSAQSSKNYLARRVHVAGQTLKTRHLAFWQAVCNRKCVGAVVGRCRRGAGRCEVATASAPGSAAPQGADGAG